MVILGDGFMIGEEKSYLQLILQKMTGFCHKLRHITLR